MPTANALTEGTLTSPGGGALLRGITVRTLHVDHAAASGTAWDRLAAQVDAAERAQAGRFRAARHRHEYLAAHVLKRRMLSEASPDILPLDWRFVRGTHGKPEVVGAAGLHVSLSHCDGLVACAVSRHGAVGLDVECLDRPAPLELAESHFAGAEQAWLRSLSQGERPAGFFRLWTLKEATLKATGSGLTQPLDSFAVSPDALCLTLAGPDRGASALGDPRAWRFVQRAVGSRHILGLAWQGRPSAAEVDISEASLEALPDSYMSWFGRSGRASSTTAA